jgi:hypothetical protein
VVVHTDTHIYIYNMLTHAHTHTHTLTPPPTHTHTHTHTNTTSQGLFLCGRDIATGGLGGDIQGGWMAANAILGYGLKDMAGGRNIATDLQKLRR